MTELRLCRHIFTDEELRQLGDELAMETDRLLELNSQKTLTTAAWNTEKKTLEASIARLAGKIKARGEHRELECQVMLNMPEPGRKTIVDPDGQVQAIEAMAEFEKQEAFNFQEPEVVPDSEFKDPQVPEES